MNGLKSTTAAIALVLSTSAHAAIIDHGNYTTDTSSGLDWLDLTETIDMTYAEVTAQLGPGGSLQGWRYATVSEVSGFFDAFGGNGHYNDTDWSPQNNGLFDRIAPRWGDTLCALNGCIPGRGYSEFFYDGVHSSPTQSTVGLIYDLASDPSSVDQEIVTLVVAASGVTVRNQDRGSALVRTVSPVPVPAAAWLFGTGILGLIGVARRRKSA